MKTRKVAVAQCDLLNWLRSWKPDIPEGAVVGSIEKSANQECFVLTVYEPGSEAHPPKRMEVYPMETAF